MAFALLGVAALVWIPTHTTGPGFTVANFFSYFTVLSNVLCAFVLGVGAVLDPSSERWDRFRGAVTTYMVITGIVYAVLLSNVDVQIQDPWTNNALHRILPLVILLDWVLVPPRSRVGARDALWWLSFPVVYGVYSLIRGPMVDWYPYPFLDPRSGGYVSLSIGLVVLLGGFVLIALAVSSLGELAGRRRYESAR
jgi:hypothetical protein